MEVGAVDQLLSPEFSHKLNIYLSEKNIETLSKDHPIKIFTSMLPLPGNGIQSPSRPTPVWANHKSNKFDDVQIEGVDGDGHKQLWFARVHLFFSFTDAMLHLHQLAYIQYYNFADEQFPELVVPRVFESEDSQHKTIVDIDSIECRRLLIPDFGDRESKFFFVYPIDRIFVCPISVS